MLCLVRGIASFLTPYLSPLTVRARVERSKQRLSDLAVALLKLDESRRLRTPPSLYYNDPASFPILLKFRSRLFPDVVRQLSTFTPTGEASKQVFWKDLLRCSLVERI